MSLPEEMLVLVILLRLSGGMKILEVMPTAASHPVSSVTECGVV